MDTAPLPEGGVMRECLAPHTSGALNLTTGREKWSSDRPRSITRSVKWNSGSPGGGSGRLSGASGVQACRATERQSQSAISPGEARWLCVGGGQKDP